ncbi:MAG TPA: flagellar biosynthesis protein FlgN [Clostridia bacterium]|nr:flagellar biosynthesis protein FlgN [Clostridia bacterium]
MRKVDGMDNIIIEKLTQLMQNKIQKLKSFYEITEKISIAVVSNNLEDLKNLLIAKQKIIEEINEIDKDFIPMYNNFKKTNKVESIFALEDKITGEVSKLKALFLEAKNLLQKIKEVDDKSRREVMDIFQKTGDKLEELSKNKEGYLQYLKYYTPDNYFLDKKR